ncbi:short-chain dehydrogenase/reductase family 9C member 7-like [Neocloeon triangulifer]|uniref:short-chain dehydrogenase/reductase family 9C member 7-like n=1 Tax=Neocloeon triangulifer TaxID=2078957 RepID=UPI00286F35AC|nr:short-chain dehydrogenase/reductase family 9C member 7-like [Neocloeon triangulifer]
MQLTESVKGYLGWFLAIFSIQWFGFSRRLIAWLGTVLLSGYFALYGSAFSSSRRARVNLISDLSKRATFITGCDTGFGKMLALRLHSMGVPVYAGVLNEKSEGAESLKAEGCKVIQIDITKDDDVKKAVDFVKKDLGEKKLHAIVNNAGIAEFGQIEWCSLELFKKVMHVNTFGTIRVTKAFLSLLKLKRGTRVVFTASVAGRYTLPGFSAYSMSKHALISFSDALRREMKPFKVSVHTIQPTLYNTPLSSTDFVANSLQKQWSDSDSEVRKSYGENYFQTFKTMYIKGIKDLARKNINEVVEDMVDALLSKEPKISYVPSLFTKFMVHFLTTIPLGLQDIILCKRTIPDVPPAGLAVRTATAARGDESEVFV